MSFRKLLALAIPLMLASPAGAVAYDRVYVFGDSLVDSGNAAVGAPLFATDPNAIPDPAPAAQGYFQGRFTNGYNYADRLSQKLGFGPAEAYLQGGTNYAVGGATTATIAPGVRPDPVNDLIPSFAQQIALYEASVNGASPPLPATTRPAIDANSLVIVTFGGNDVRNLLQYGVPDPLASTTALASGLQTLIGDGARNIVVVGLPDIGKIPSVIGFGSAAQAAGSALSGALNTAYFAAASGANAGLAGTGSVQFFDLFALQNTVTQAPGSFGLDASLLQRDCVDDGAQAGGCSGYLFFDGIHPTAQVHGIIADRIAAQLGISAVPETTTWIMLVVGFGTIGCTIRRSRRDQLGMAQ